MNESFLQLGRALLPEACLVLGALVVLGFDLATGRSRNLRQRMRFAAALATAAVFGALCFAISLGALGSVFGGVFQVDRLAVGGRLGILLLTQLTLVIASGTTRLRNPAEYVALILFAATGLSLMAAANQLLVAFVALELASLSLYVLAGFDKTRATSAEAALKYFLTGAIAAAFLLFGFSLLFGLTGSIDVATIARQLTTQPMSPLLIVALVMVVVAFGFKAAAAPFHLWAPDAYEGAPPASAALIASASKLAGFIFFSRLLWTGFGPAAGNVAQESFMPGWLPVLALLSLASLFLGNLAALAQSNVRRLLAYSAIAHAGALLLGVIAAGAAGAGPLFFYASTYGIATVGAFGVVAAIARSSRCEELSDLAGLHRRSPLLAVCLLVFVLSLAGIPPLAGFFGKFAVFAAALSVNGLSGILGWLAVLAILFSAVGLYYYLLILKQVFVAEPPAGATPISVPVETAIALIGCAVLLAALGVLPSVVLRLV